MAKMTLEAQLDRMRQLANLTEGRDKKSFTLGNLHETLSAADGRTYGIVQEQSHYFIKVTNKKGQGLNEADFVYLGGIENKLEERYNSFSEAKRRLQGKVASINEMLGEEELPAEEEAPVEEVPMEEPAPEAEPAPAQEPAPQPEAEPAPAPAQEPAPEAAPAEEMPAADGEEMPIEEPAAEEEMPAADPAEGTPSEEGGEGDADAITTMVGKITHMMRSEDLTDDMYMNILNSVISATDFEKIGEDNMQELVLRIKTGGKKMAEGEVNVRGLYERETVEEMDADFDADNITETKVGQMDAGYNADNIQESEVGGECTDCSDEKPKDAPEGEKELETMDEAAMRRDIKARIRKFLAN